MSTANRHPMPTPARVVSGPDELLAAVGQELGVSAWHDVTQAEIDGFADATGDHFWIHVDQERAAAGPMGGTIAHGLYTLSLGPRFKYAIVGWEGLGIALNYGYGRVRFPAPLPVGTRVRMRLRLDAARSVGDGWEVTLMQTFEREHAERPVCVAEFLLRFIPEPERMGPESLEGRTPAGKESA